MTVVPLLMLLRVWVVVVALLPGTVAHGQLRLGLSEPQALPLNE